MNKTIRSGRLLIAMIDGGGTVPPTLGVAAELVRRGHQVRVLADPTVATDARTAGCAFSEWREAPHFNTREEQSALLAAFESRNPYRALKAVRNYAGDGMTGRFVREVVSTTREFGADAILAEALVPGMIIGGLASGVPTAALMANIYLRPTVGYPLFGTGWSPGEGVIAKSRDKLVPEAARWLLARSLAAPERCAQKSWPAARFRAFRTIGQVQPGAGDD
jgi:hypothetical protein